jgi:hypothetical protein
MKLLQLPNKSALSWMSSGLAYMSRDKAVKKVAFVPFVTSLGVWSFGELTRGINPVRRAMGAAGLIATAVITLNNFRQRDLSKFRK